MADIIGDYSFKLIEGDLWGGFMVRITTKEEEDSESLPLDLTGASVTMNISTPDDTRGKSIKISTFNGGITITDAINGSLKLNEQKIKLPSGIYEHSLMVRFPDGKTRTYFKGEVTIIHNNTAKFS